MSEESLNFIVLCLRDQGVRAVVHYVFSRSKKDSSYTAFIFGEDKFDVDKRIFSGSRREEIYQSVSNNYFIVDPETDQKIGVCDYNFIPTNNNEVCRLIELLSEVFKTIEFEDMLGRGYEEIFSNKIKNLRKLVNSIYDDLE